MNQKEKELFKALCKITDSKIDDRLICFATPSVLGHLFFNRMQGTAYYVLAKNGLLGKVNREFRNSLSSAYEQNVQRNRSFRKCVSTLSHILSSCDCKVAMLKGAYLCTHYPDGCRTSNDVDLLVSPKDVTTIGNLLSGVGFVQGNIRNGEFIPATRQEIIESKMMRGETIPYIKEVNLPFMKFFELDINFSLDYKNGNNDIIFDMLTGVCIKNEKGMSVPTLNDTDFFIHLCAHLYKEATTLPWIKMHRDMTLYKYCDIYMLLSEMQEDDVEQVFKRGKQLNLDKICAYAILETMELFNFEYPRAYQLSVNAIENDPDFLLRVISPSDKKILMYKTASANDRFFLKSRVTDLKEVEPYEKN